MIDPKFFEKSPFSSRAALALGLLCAGGFGLAAAFLIKTKPAALGEKPVRPESVWRGAEPLPGVGEKPSTPSEPAANSLIRFCSENVSSSRSFVIFRYGTCVLVNEPTQDPVGDARKLLEACNEPEARFIPELTQEGNLVIGFKEPVFHSFTAAEMERLRPEVEHLAALLLTPKEKVEAGDDWAPPTHAAFGLLARRRMLEDASEPVPVKVIRSSERFDTGE